MYGPYLSAIVAGQALTPATRHSLGRLLPHQLADRSKAPLKAGSYALCQIPDGTWNMQDYPVFRRDVLHFEIDSLPLLTRLPLAAPFDHHHKHLLFITSLRLIITERCGSLDLHA